MGVDDKSGGAKRKIEEAAADVHPETTSAPKALLAITDAPAAEATADPLEDTCVANAPNRKTYLASLQAKVAEEAVRAQREARSSPHGHGSTSHARSFLP